MSTKTIRIGNGAGFWGDSLHAPLRLVESGNLDYLTLEYLAELTMSILAHLKLRDADTGYVTDFPLVVESLLESLETQPSLKIVTNAGGMNPSACAKQIAKLLADTGRADRKIAAVSGDDLLNDLESHQAAGELFAHLDTGQPLSSLDRTVVAANAYLGAEGIAAALRQQAQIVITGRVADAALTLGPALHEFGWSNEDWDRLAAATVAGHLIECGAQVTGGMYSDWTPTTELNNVGYPIAELTVEGECVITKSADSGGVVDVGTVSEQLIYEIGDPAHYLTPDVDVDFTSITLQDLGGDRVNVSGAKGNSAPETLKVSLAYRDGYKATGMLTVVGPQAEEKARACAKLIFSRVEEAGFTLDHTEVELLGTGETFPGTHSDSESPWEVVLRVSARSESKAALERFTREFAPLVTSGPPGVTGYTGGRPKVQPVLAYWPTTIARSRVSAIVETKTAQEWLT